MEKFSTMSTEVQIIESSNVNSIPIEEEFFMNRMNIKNLLESDWCADIHEYIVTVRRKITEVVNYFRWYYITCNVYSKKIEPAYGVYGCLNCKKDCKFLLVKKDSLKLKLNTYNLKEGLENFTVSKHWIPDDKLKLEDNVRKEKKVENLLEDESIPKDHGTKELSKEK
ncbi:Coatomer subunit gamma-2, partial [Datura stramonium]|nr:Coatomer subunit gamma-2 [Datura stramonium]